MRKILFYDKTVNFNGREKQWQIYSEKFHTEFL